MLPLRRLVCGLLGVIPALLVAIGILSIVSAVQARDPVMYSVHGDDYVGDAFIFSIIDTRAIQSFDVRPAGTETSLRSPMCDRREQPCDGHAARKTGDHSLCPEPGWEAGLVCRHGTVAANRPAGYLVDRGRTATRHFGTGTDRLLVGAGHVHRNIHRVIPACVRLIIPTCPSRAIVVLNGLHFACILRARVSHSRSLARLTRRSSIQTG